VHAEHPDHAIGGGVAIGVEQDVGVAAGLVEPTDLTCGGEYFTFSVLFSRLRHSHATPPRHNWNPSCLNPVGVNWRLACGDRLA
jgi:hypothetical protein